MKKYLFAISVFLIFSCGNEKKETVETKQQEEPNAVVETPVHLSDLYFLEGMWTDSSATMDGFHEKWIRHGDTSMEVIGCYINGTDTAIMESIKVKEINGVLNYIPLVTGQNDGQEIYFKLESGSTKDSLAFTNYKHNFPKEIIYVKRNNNNLSVYLSGVDENSQPQNFYLPLVRKE